MFLGTADCATPTSVGNDLNIAYADMLFDRFGNRVIVTASTIAAFTTSLTHQANTTANFYYSAVRNWGVALIGDVYKSGLYDLLILHEGEVVQIATTTGCEFWLALLLRDYC